MALDSSEETVPSEPPHTPWEWMEKYRSCCIWPKSCSTSKTAENTHFVFLWFCAKAAFFPWLAGARAEDAPQPGPVPRLLLPGRVGDALTLLALRGLNFLPKPEDLAKELL